MRHPFVCTVLVAAALLAACDAPRSLSPNGPAPGAARADAVPVTSDADPLASAIAQLYTQNLDKETAKSASAALAAYAAIGREDCAHVADLVTILLADYRANAFGTAGDEKLAAQLKTVLDAVSAPCGALSRGFPLAALLPNGAAVYVRAAVGGKVETLDGLAGANVPAGSLPADALLTITRLPYDGTGAEKILGTTLAAGPFYAIATYPHFDALVKPIQIGLVQVGPFTLPKSVDAILGHLPTGGTTETPDPEQCTVPSRLVGLFVAPTYLRSGLSLSASRAPRGISRLVAVHDSSGTAGGCGSAGSLSPFGLVQVYDPGSQGKAALSAANVCGARFEIANASSGDLVAIWRAIPKDGGLRIGQMNPTPVIVRAGSHVTVDAGPAAGAIRVDYGPTLVTSVPVSASACGAS